MVLLRAQVSLWVIATIATVVPLAAATCAFTNKDFDVKPDEPFNLTWTSDTELGVDITLNRLDVEEDHMRLLQYIVSKLALFVLHSVREKLQGGPNFKLFSYSVSYHSFIILCDRLY